MLFKTAFIGISAIAAVFILSSYQTDGQKIIWDKNYKLKWEDYKSPPDSQRPDIKAGSSVGHGSQASALLICADLKRDTHFL